MRGRLTAVALLFAAACGGRTAPQNDGLGSVRVTVGVSRSALEASDVSSVGIVATNVATLAASTFTITNTTDGAWSATFPVPTGTYDIVAQAYDIHNNVLYAGSVDSVTVTVGSNSQIYILAQEAEGSVPPPYSSVPPQITGVTVLPSSTVNAGDTVNFSATASGAANPSGGNIHYLWSTTSGQGGFFDDPTISSPVWTAPSVSGSYDETVTVTVTNDNGDAATFSFQIHVVGTQDLVGSAPFLVEFNNWPVVSSMQLSPTQVALDDSVTLTVLASDADGNDMTYGYSFADCSGTMTQDEVDPRVAHFTPTVLGTRDGLSNQYYCTLLVAVDDGRGGMGYGNVRLWILP